MTRSGAAFLCRFLVPACAAKGMSVGTAARLSGAGPATATRLAVAMNARGTLGVVVASVTPSAGIIGERFFTALVLMSIVTSQIAGFRLGRAFRGAERGPAVAPAGGLAYRRDS